MIKKIITTKSMQLGLTDIKSLLQEKYGVDSRDIIVKIGSDYYYGDPWCDFMFDIKCEESVLVCEHCGKECDEHMRYCPYCGTKLDEKEPTK